MWTCVLVAGWLLAAGGGSLGAKQSGRARGGASSRLHGGQQVDIVNHPWQVSVMWDGEHVCGGSIIHAQWVLTAAHCIVYGRPIWYRVRAGSDTINEGGRVYNASDVFPHHRFDWKTEDYDIGLIKTEKPIFMDNHASAIGLATKEAPFNSSAHITGWGTTETSPFSSRLLFAEVSIVNRTVCNATYKGLITSRMICAGAGGDGKGPCDGDAGGPLVVDGVQHGIVSWAVGCGDPVHPGVFTSVVALRHWIRNKVGV